MDYPPLGGQPLLVMMAALFLSIWGTRTIIHTPVDALPDL